jgi:hypothetical protein
MVGVLTMLWAMFFFRAQLGPMVEEVLRQSYSPAGAGGTLSDNEIKAIEEAVSRAAPVVTLLFGVLAAFEFLAAYSGWALMAYRPWARPFNIVVSIFDLFGVPIGTAIGIYSLWVLFRPETIALFARRPLEQDPSHL